MPILTSLLKRGLSQGHPFEFTMDSGAYLLYSAGFFQFFCSRCCFAAMPCLNTETIKNIPGQDKHSGSCFLRRCATRNAAASFFRSAVPYMFCWLRLSAPSSSANRLRLYPSPLCWCPTQWPLWWEKPLARVCFINTNRLKAPSHFL